MDGRGSYPPGAGGSVPVATPVQERVEPRPREAVWRYTAPARDTSVPILRHAVRDLVRRQGALLTDELAQTALLILSELVTNSVRHAALLTPEIAVEVTIGGGWLRIAVEDGHPYRPTALAAEPGPEETGGRGLLLVRTLATEAGGYCDAERTRTGGKVVRAALPVPAA